ncbi:MAG: response regulator, partial [Oligoflexia bacterium]|nr:response regulator [Oligoflexia bacterium]
LGRLEKDLEKFDLVLTDISMPELSGAEVAKICRRLRPGFPVVAISGHAREEPEVQEVLQAGAVDAIIKPFTDIEKIAGVIRMRIEEWKGIK